jgi:sulfoxide reductase heme-binding subunit YedZ
MFSYRLNQRLLKHHLPLALLTLAAGVPLYLTRSYPDVIARLSFASAYPALVLLSATLLIGPFKLLSGERPAVSLDLRRDIGIWAGIVGLFHTGMGQCVHLRGRPWLYYVYDAAREKHLIPIRHDLFGFSNYTGLAAALILLALLATSNDASLKKLGTPGWKQLQRWNYYCFGLTALHTFGYQKGVSNENWPYVATALLAVGITVALQWMGWQRRRGMGLAVRNGSPAGN